MSNRLIFSFEEIQLREKAQRQCDIDRDVKQLWCSDFILVEGLRNLIPSPDIILLQIYANIYKKDLSGYTKEELGELVGIYSSQLSHMVFDKLFTLIRNIVATWKQIILNRKFSVPVSLSVTSSAKPAFEQLLQLYKATPDTDDTNAFNRFESSMLSESENWWEPHNKDLDASRYLIDVSTMECYFNYIDEKIANCFKSANNSKNTIAIDYRQKLDIALRCVRLLLLIIHQVKIESVERTIDEQFKVLSEGCVVLTGRNQWYNDKSLAPELLAISQHLDNYASCKIQHIICLPVNRPITVDTSKQTNLQGFRQSIEFKCLSCLVAKEQNAFLNIIKTGANKE